MAPIVLHSPKAKLLGRVELADDPAVALDRQREFVATTVGTPVILDPPTLVEFDNDRLPGVEIFDHAERIMASALDVSPAAAGHQLAVGAVAALVRTAADERSRVDGLLRSTTIPDFLTYALTQAAPYVDGWMGGGVLGNYGADVRLRTAVNYVGIWANTSDEVVYFVGTRDADDEQLHGAHNYLLRFPPDRLPSSVVDAYWSIILLGVPDFRVVPNDRQRYNLNSCSPLTLDADGSLTITMGPEAPMATPESNWLPTDPHRPFSLTFRCYVPRGARPAGSWSPPAVQRIR